MRERIQQWREAALEFQRFVLHDIWRLGAPGETVPQGFVVKQLRVLILLSTKLFDGTHMLRASSLTFATILSIVPFIAIMLIMINSFDLDKNLFDKTGAIIEDTAESVSGVFTGDESGDTTDASETVPGETSESGETESTDDASSEASTPSNAPAPAESATPDPGATSPDDAPPDGENADGLPDPESAQAPEEQSELVRAFRELAFQGFGESETDSDVVNPVDFVFGVADGIVNNPDRPSGAVLGLSGFLLVLTTVFGLMRNLELSFNRIWGIRKGRPWIRKTADYFVITLLLPFVTAVVLGAMAALQSDAIRDLLGPFSYLLRFVQHIAIVLVIALLYKLIPNTTVRWRYAFLAGFIAGTAWVILSWSYVQFQFGLSRQEEVLGSLAMFPLFLMWIYLSWAVLLFGAELAFAYQNESTFALERHAEEASPAYREAVGLRAMTDIARRFAAGEAALVRETAAREWNIPPSLLGDALESLKDAGYIVECAAEPIGYQPARPLDKINAAQVLETLRRTGSEPSELRRDPSLTETFAVINEHPEISMNDLIERVKPRAPDDADAAGKPGSSGEAESVDA